MRLCSIFDLPYTGTPRFNITLYKTGDWMVDARHVEALLSHGAAPPHYLSAFRTEYAKVLTAWQGMTNAQRNTAVADPKITAQVYEWLSGWVKVCLYEGDTDSEIR